MSSLPSNTKSGTAALIVRRKDGRAVARCGRCRTFLTIVRDNEMPPSIEPRGFQFAYVNDLVGCRDGVWRPSSHRHKQRARDHEQIAMGRAEPAVHARFRRADYGQQSDPSHRYDPFVVPGEPIVDRAVFDKRRLPVRVECPDPGCRAENRIGSDGTE